VEAFILVAGSRPDTHFVFLGGLDTDEFVRTARRRIDASHPELAGRFTFISDNISREACASLMGIADVFTSLCSRVDMRSKSVLEAAAAGGAPVLAESEEYRMMHEQGFQAEFVDAGSARQVADAVLRLLRTPSLRLRISEENRRFLAEHEDSERQMDRLLETVLEAVARRNSRH
jgi:glycosyltransferase involved in cell wall biosynthesis